MASDSTEGSRVGNEEAWHALLHDLRGCLGGLKATLDLREEGEGLPPRESARLALGVREGLVLVDLARALSVGPWPDGSGEPTEAWRKALEPDLSLLASAFRTTASVRLKGSEPWPGPLLRSFTLSLARLVLPQSAPDPLILEGEVASGVESGEWVLRFRPVLAPPLALQPGATCKDLHGLWVRAVAARHGFRVHHAEDTLTVSIPFRAKGLPPVE